MDYDEGGIRLRNILCQFSAWQSAMLLPMSCKSVQPVPAFIKDPVSPVGQSFSGDATNNPQTSRNWYALASAYSAAGGEHDPKKQCTISS